MENIERVISIGLNCSTKGHINAFFKKTTVDANISLQGRSDLFDWVQIHDYDKLCEVFNNKFDLFFEREDMRLNKPSELFNNKNKIRYPHLFHSHFDGITSKTDKVDDEFIDKNFFQIREKIE